MFVINRTGETVPNIGSHFQRKTPIGNSENLSRVCKITERARRENVVLCNKNSSWIHKMY